jgi:hypothetical protein
VRLVRLLEPARANLDFRHVVTLRPERAPSNARSPDSKIRRRAAKPGSLAPPPGWG